jgi:superfamily II DNA/RNA helicase
MEFGILKFYEYVKKLNEENQSTQKIQDLENEGILVIVDVQGEFDEYTPKGFEQNIMKYCEEFPKDDIKGVYQIWDANKATGFTYTFPNQVLDVKKNYGTKFNPNLKQITDKLPQDVKEGKLFKFKNVNKYIVKVNNNHKWFYVNEDLYNLFQKLKGKKVIVIGGADSECLQDVYISMKSFGIIPVYNHNYIYNASMNDDMVSTNKEQPNQNI